MASSWTFSTPRQTPPVWTYQTPELREPGEFSQFQYPTPPLAVYPTEAIEAHHAFIARRRTLRPNEEYRIPPPEEWDSFLGYFERRKLSVGTCGRAFGTRLRPLSNAPP